MHYKSKMQHRWIWLRIEDQDSPVSGCYLFQLETLHEPGVACPLSRGQKWVIIMRLYVTWQPCFIRRVLVFSAIESDDLLYVKTSQSDLGECHLDKGPKAFRWGWNESDSQPFCPLAKIGGVEISVPLFLEFIMFLVVWEELWPSADKNNKHYCLTCNKVK